MTFSTTPGSPAFVESSTTPVMLPRSDCARPHVGVAKTKAVTRIPIGRRLTMLRLHRNCSRTQPLEQERRGQRCHTFDPGRIQSRYSKASRTDHLSNHPVAFAIEIQLAARVDREAHVGTAAHDEPGGTGKFRRLTTASMIGPLDHGEHG